MQAIPVKTSSGAGVQKTLELEGSICFVRKHSELCTLSEPGQWQWPEGLGEDTALGKSKASASVTPRACCLETGGSVTLSWVLSDRNGNLCTEMLNRHTGGGKGREQLHRCPHSGCPFLCMTRCDTHPTISSKDMGSRQSQEQRNTGYKSMITMDFY